MPVPDIRCGEYLVIRVDGTETRIEQTPTMPAIQRAIGCECCDTVTLKRSDPAIVMVVDDTGMVDGKPVNSKATELYHTVRPGTPYAIHGDVAIVNDEDFA